MTNLKQKLEQIILESHVVIKLNVTEVKILQLKIEKLLWEANKLGYQECAESTKKILSQM